MIAITAMIHPTNQASTTIMLSPRQSRVAAARQEAAATERQRARNFTGRLNSVTITPKVFGQTPLTPEGCRVASTRREAAKKERVRARGIAARKTVPARLGSEKPPV